MNGKLQHLHSNTNQVENSIYKSLAPNEDEVFKLKLIKKYQQKLPEMTRYSGGENLSTRIENWDKKHERTYNREVAKKEQNRAKVDKILKNLVIPQNL